MAERVVSLLVERLEALIEQEIELLRGVNDEIRYIKDEFKSIRAFLRKADAMVDNDEQMEVWVNQVRDVANEIEHVLNKYNLAHHKNHGGCGCVSSPKGIFQGIAGCFKCLPTKHDIAARIRDIKARVQIISERRQRYDMNNSVIPIAANKMRDPREDALFLDESQIVGIDGPRKILIGFLSEADTRLGVISVYGMGGLGKTTLAKKVYEASIVKMKFRHRAWITVSEVVNAKSLLTDLYIQLFGMVEGLDKIDLLKLKQKINSNLQGKRYLVVLDDIWQMDAWKAFKNALPNDNNSCSRIIITTRFEIIAEAAGRGGVSGHLYPLKALNAEDSWELFSKKVFSSSSNRPLVPTQELRECATKFLDKCKGLPLGLVAIGGLLSTKPLREWEQVYERFQEFMNGSVLSEVDDIRLVISFSYNELPNRLKSCFLYLGIFPEDYSINCAKLFRMWVAEGCVVRGEQQANLSMEELSKPSLEDLIQRSLVQVEVEDARKGVVTCKIHDLVRDFIIGKADNQNCKTVFCSKEEVSSHLRYSEDHSSHLRVLFIEYFKFEDFKTMNLSNLRYLGVRRFGNALEDSFSIGKFKHLETLDFRGEFVPHLGDEILQLTQLRNLLTGKVVQCLGTGLPAGIHRLQKLETLSLVSLHSHRPREKRYGKGLSSNELGMLTQLRKLSVCDLTDDDETKLFGSIEKMKFLKTFKVSKESLEPLSEEKFLHAQDSFSFPPSLQCLFMRGKLEQLPPWISSLRNLERLFLSELYAEDNFMESLQALPNLMVLRLGGGRFEEFGGGRRYEELRFSGTGFPRLRKLDLVDFRFEEMRVEEGAMPDIRSISFADYTSGLIEGLTYLTTLQEIVIQLSKYGSYDLVRRLEKYSWQQGHNPQIVDNRRARQPWPFTLNHRQLNFGNVYV